MQYKIKIKKIKNTYKIVLFTLKRNFVFSVLLNRKVLVNRGFTVSVKSVRYRLLVSGNILEKLIKIGIIS
jgi:hypothetical protein